MDASIVERAARALGHLVIPCVWVETCLLRMLHVEPMTTFRMFPPQQVHPVAILLYFFAVVFLLLVPSLVTAEGQRQGGTLVGFLVYPLTRRAGSRVAHAVMFIRVWLIVAWVNSCILEMHTPAGAIVSESQMILSDLKASVAFCFV